MDPETAFALGVMPGTTINVDPSSAFPIAGQTGSAGGTGTGQHGVSPLIGGGGSIADAINSTWTWLNTPFTQVMSPTGIMLVVGAVIVSILIWNMLLYHIRIAAETL